MFAWEVEVPAISGDNSVPINAAIASLSTGSGGGTVYLDAAVYTVSNPVLRKRNVFIKGAFKAPGQWETVATKGTIVRWTGASGGNVFIDQPSDDPAKILNGGISDLTIDGAGLANAGLSSLNAYFAQYARMHCFGVTSYAYYFGTLPTTSVEQNRNNLLDGLSAALAGSANGFTLDGTPGSGRNTCFMVAKNCAVSHLNGHGFMISNGDDNCFYGCSASRGTGGAGMGVLFGGSSDGSGKAAYGTQMYGFWSNGGIHGVGGSSPSRGNIVYTTGVDGLPLIYQDSGAVLTVVSVAGESTGEYGFIRNPLPAG